MILKQLYQKNAIIKLLTVNNLEKKNYFGQFFCCKTKICFSEILENSQVKNDKRYLNVVK